MSEIKLCPMKKDVILQNFGHLEDFLPCVQEKCTWWVEARQISKTYDPAIKMTKDGLLIIEGHCVALDWGKP